MSQNRMEQFTQRARRVLSLAQSEAEKMNTKRINPGHVLLAMLLEPKTVAHVVLTRHNLDYTSTYNLISPVLLRQSQSEQVELSGESKRLLERAVDASRRRGHRYIGTEHLLLGMVERPAEEIDMVLRAANLRKQAIQKTVDDVLRESPTFDQQVSTDRSVVFTVQLKHAQAREDAAYEPMIAKIPYDVLIERLHNPSSDGVIVLIDNDDCKIDMKFEK